MCFTLEREVPAQMLDTVPAFISRMGCTIRVYRKPHGIGESEEGKGASRGTSAADGFWSSRMAVLGDEAHVIRKRGMVGSFPLLEC